jgi:hypothetical protein
MRLVLPDDILIHEVFPFLLSTENSWLPTDHEERSREDMWDGRVVMGVKEWSEEQQIRICKSLTPIETHVKDPSYDVPNRNANKLCIPLRFEITYTEGGGSMARVFLQPTRELFAINSLDRMGRSHGVYMQLSHAEETVSLTSNFHGKPHGVCHVTRCGTKIRWEEWDHGVPVGRWWKLMPQNQQSGLIMMREFHDKADIRRGEERLATVWFYRPAAEKEQQFFYAMCSVNGTPSAILLFSHKRLPYGFL